MLLEDWSAASIRGQRYLSQVSGNNSIDPMQSTIQVVIALKRLPVKKSRLRFFRYLRIEFTPRMG